MKNKPIVILYILLQAIISSAHAEDAFNNYILKAVDKLNKEEANKGYDINSYFTKEISYGPEIIKSNNSPKTMCVAAVAETIITAINLYSEETKDATVYDKLPSGAWNKSSRLMLRPYIFQLKHVSSKGTGEALKIYGLGKELQFPELKAGDFITYSRTNKTGHAAVFLDFLDKDGKVINYNKVNVVGFKYFSAQGKGKPYGGLYTRNGYFDGFCPTPRSRDDDCNIIKRRYLNMGRMYHPKDWQVESSVANLKSTVVSSLRGRGIYDSNKIQNELKKEFALIVDERFTGE